MGFGRVVGGDRTILYFGTLVAGFDWLGWGSDSVMGLWFSALFFVTFLGFVCFERILKNKNIKL